MGDTLKRQRDIDEEGNTNPKRHKNYDDDDQIIISLLEEVEDEPNQDLSSLMTSLEQELYSDQFNKTFTASSESDHLENPTAATSVNSNNLDEKDDKESVIRHLLEASDDELGIPNRVEEDREDESGSNNNGVDSFCSMSLVEGLWELEDEAANYYTLLQSELFL